MPPPIDKIARLKACKEYAKNKYGGDCITTEFLTATMILTWICVNLHQFEASERDVISKSRWCPKCPSAKSLEIFEKIKLHAISKNGEFVSKCYTRNDVDLWFVCEEDHLFSLTYRAILSAEKATNKKLLYSNWCYDCYIMNTHYKECRDYAIAQGGVLNSTSYKNTYEVLSFTCKNNHTFLASRNNTVVADRFCKKCSGYPDLEQCNYYAKLVFGGICLSKEYLPVPQKMHWKCWRGHTFYAIFANIKNNNAGCKECLGKSDIKIGHCHTHAAKNNGICKSLIYENLNAKMLWCCNIHGDFTVAFAGMWVTGSFCAKCAGTAKIEIAECRQYAIQHGGVCESDEIANNKTKLKWLCNKCGYRWESKFDSMKHYGTWCGNCAGNILIPIEECQQIAISRNGKLLSTSRIGKKDLLEWKCHVDTHPSWFATIDSVKNKHTWCAYCKMLRSEKLVLKLLTKHTKLTFIKIRPIWLNKLELDGYNEVEKIAYEFQGIQHYKFDKFFHSNDINKFNSQRKRDILKRKLLAENNIDLIDIPYHFGFKNEENLSIYIELELQKIYIRRKVCYKSSLFEIKKITENEIYYYNCVKCIYYKTNIYKFIDKLDNYFTDKNVVQPTNDNMEYDLTTLHPTLLSHLQKYGIHKI